MPLPPRLSFRRPRNLGNIISRAKRPSATHQTAHTCEPCKIKKLEQNPSRKPRCEICPLLPSQTQITSSATQKTHKLLLLERANCDSIFVVYCLTCTKCNLQYVGKAENFRLRVNNHKSCITKKKPDDQGCRILYSHFADPGHDLSDVKFTILQTCADA